MHALLKLQRDATNNQSDASSVVMHEECFLRTCDHFASEHSFAGTTLEK